MLAGLGRARLGFALARHGDAALAAAAPACRQGKFSRRERAAAHAADDGDGFEFSANRAAGHAGHRGFGVEQRGHVAAQRGRGEQRALRGGQRNARPVFADAVGVVGEVGRAVADGQRVHPDQFGGGRVGVRVGQGEGGEVGAGGG